MSSFSASTPSVPKTVSYKFLGGLHTCPEQILTDIQNTKTFPPAASTTILNTAFDIARRMVMHDETLDLVTATDTLCSTTGAKAKPVRNLVRTLICIIQGIVKHGLSLASVKEDLVNLGFEMDTAENWVQIWQKQGNDITQAVTDRSIDNEALVDAEWRFGVTVSTDDLAKVGSTFLQMKLTTLHELSSSSTAAASSTLTNTVANNNTILQQHHLELTIPQFYDLLSQLEKAKSYVEYLGQSGM